MKRTVKLFVLCTLIFLMLAGPAFAGDQLRQRVQDPLQDGSCGNCPCPSLLNLCLGTSIFDTALSTLEDQYPVRNLFRAREQLRDGSCLDETDPLDKPLRLRDGSCQEVPDEDETIEATVTQSQDRDYQDAPNHDRTPDKTQDRTRISR